MIHVSPTGIISSLSPSWCRLSSSRRRHAAVLCYASFPWSQDKLSASASSFNNVSSRHLSSRAKTEALNPHHCRQPPFSNRLTLILHCYKKVISTLVTLPTTQPCLYFASSVAREPHHQSSTHRRHSLPLSSHTHHPSPQRHPQ
jgi:hypothetical protein